MNKEKEESPTPPDVKNTPIEEPDKKKEQKLPGKPSKKTPKKVK